MSPSPSSRAHRSAAGFIMVNLLPNMRMAKSEFAGSIEFRREALPSPAILEAEWRALQAAADPSFFNSWYWIGTFLAALPEASRPSLLRGSVQGETVALALLGARLVRRRHGLIRSRVLYMNETGDPDFDLTIEHNGLLVRSSDRQAAVDALIGWFAEHSADADELHMSGWRQPEAEHVVEGRGLGHSQAAVPGYWVELGRLAASDGELYPVLSGNARQQLRRSMRHFQTFGQLQLEQATTLAEAHAFFTGLKELHVATWESRGKPHSFSRGFFELFHRLLIERHAADGVIQLLRVTAGPRLIGYLYNFRLSDHVYAYQSGFAYGEQAARPGAIAHALAISNAYRSGASTYDFLAGRNRLKESYATHSGPMHWQVIQQPRLAFRAECVARGVKQRVESQLANLRQGKKMLRAQRQDDGSSHAS
jgi:CelD/BcsL family acetyltransferase involved in cellulose biosynthesis